MGHWETPESAVSVLVPTYNRAHFLPETLDSILSQTYSPAEIIVVDDGSTDDTQDVVSRLYPKVKYHRINNSGVCTARNIAASFATSPYIAFCDSDDLWRQDKLEKQMELHLRHPEVQHSFTNFSIVTEGNWARETKFDGARPTFFAHCEKALDFALICGASLYDELLTFQPIFPSTTLMSRDFFYRIGGYKDSLGRVLSEDLEFALRCVQHAPIGIITEPVVGIRKHTSNFSGSTFATTCGEIEILNYALQNHSVTESTKELLADQIALRRVGASYGAFSAGRFTACKELLSAIPNRYLTPKLRLKLLISNSPEPIARFLQKLFVQS
ncbi:glycosyltransferase [Edaphobacter paludis]|uniref:Glycosyltransferase n=1 Tax=Edaphobacter paludis TaxID=3035702 RepID=A0AAU7CXR3_9BACT